MINCAMLISVLSLLPLNTYTGYQRVQRDREVTMAFTNEPVSYSKITKSNTTTEQ